MGTPTPISGMPVAPGLDGTELIPIVVTGVISGITQAINAVATLNNTNSVNPFSAGQNISFGSIGGMTQLNGTVATISATGGVSGAWTLTFAIDSTGFGAYTSGGVIEGNARTTLADSRLNATGSPYNPTFLSGGVHYNGPNGVVAADNNLIFGKSVPNPSGVNGPCLLLGSGGGGGTNVTFAIIMDQAFDTATPGNDLIITAGEVQPSSTQRGGNLLIVAGGADAGPGGAMTIQGGTSLNGAAGPAILQGGNSTNEVDPAGDAFVIAGQVGSVGGTVHLIMTLLNGVAGVIRHRVNSDILWDEFNDGSWFFYKVGGGTYGDAGAPIISRGAGQPVGPAQASEVIDHVEVINGKTFTWVKGLLKSVV